LFNTVTGSGAIHNTGSTTATGDFTGFSGSYTHDTAFVSTTLNTATATSKDAAYVIASVQGSSQGMIAAGDGDYTLELGSLTGVADSLFRGGNVATGLTTLQVGNLNGNDTLSGSINNGVTKTIAFTKVGTGTMTLAGVNTYTGNTTVDAGTLALADDGELRFVIGANGVNNSISGTGTVTFDGDFNLDLTAADPTTGNSWTLVNVGTLNETFGSTFSLVGFTESANVHQRTVGTDTFSFTNTSGPGGSLQYTLPAGEPMNFVRLAVMPE
jgi:autotransporter-associated beta strand protein